MFILIDVYHNIACAQGFFKYTSDCVNNIEIIFKPSSLCLSFCKNELLQNMNIKLPGDFLHPSSISSVCSKIAPKYVIKHENVTKINFPLYTTDTISTDKSRTIQVAFRIQVSNKMLLKTHSDSVDFKNFMHSEFQTMQVFHMVCTQCGGLLSNEDIKFHSVLKYYEGVSESSDSWFCHKHDDHKLTDIKGKLEETPYHSLYIDNLYFYFHSSVVKSLVLSETNKEYKCIKCSSVLSLKKKMDNPSYIGFFSDEIMFVDSEVEMNVIKSYRFNSAMASLCSVISELLKSGLECKIYLQSKVGDTTSVILLWVNSQKVAQFLFPFETDADIPSEMNFETKEVYKVLYSICPSDSEASRKWKHDFGVEFFQISDNMMRTVRETLLNTSEYFPEDHRAIKGFSFGYLPACPSML